MPELEKATLTAISSDPKRPETFWGPVEVQFNPTTLKLQVENHVEGGKTQPRQTRQYLGTGSRMLTLELVFDTADEGTTDRPRSVREKTDIVEGLALPRADRRDKQAPPKARFQWGELVVEGVVESVSIDFEHFASNGTPLRAKCALSIKEQDVRFEQGALGAGANEPPTGQKASGAPGTAGSGSDRTATALAGESAADFAARMGLDPAAWRGLAAGIESPLALPAGLEIGFDASVGAGMGVGLAAGVAAGAPASASLESRFGLDAAGAASASAASIPKLAAGFSLAAAGGVGTAIESVKMAQADTGQREARASFAIAPAGAPAAPSRPAMPAQSRAPLARTGLPRPGRGAEPAPEPPRADLRAVSFGLGVPLRPTFGRAARLRARGSASPPPTTDDPTVPRWRELPECVSTGPAADPRRHGAGCACGCGRRRR